MPDLKHFRLPDVGEGLTEAEIVTWRVKPGDTVKVNDMIVEIETAKSLVELPSPYAGVVADLLVPEGQTVDVGTPIIAVDTDPSATAPPIPPSSPGDHAMSVPPAGRDRALPDPTPRDDLLPPAAPEEGAVEPGLIGGPAPGGRTSVLVGYGPRTTEAKRRPRKAVPTTQEPAARVAHQAVSGYADAPAAPERLLSPERAPTALPGASSTPTGSPDGSDGDTVASDDAPEAAAYAQPGRVSVLAKPPVRKLAKSLGIDLAAVEASGPGGVISRADVEAAAARLEQPSGPAPAEPPPAAAALPVEAPPIAVDGRETRLPIRGVRKATAAAMVRSAFTAPHVTEWVSVDATRTVKLVERLKARSDFEGVRVGPLLLVAKALLVAARRNPGINAAWDEDAQEIVLKHYVNLGIAAATPRGLIVPNIKDAQALPLPELARALNALIATARDGKTSPEDMQGGTITITNVGVFGVDSGTPILNPGESAILAVGAIRPMPWVVKGRNKDRVKPRQVTQLALSFDHRLVDGELGSRFLADIAAMLHDPELLTVWA